MLTRDQFIADVLAGGAVVSAASCTTAGPSDDDALPDGMPGFEQPALALPSPAESRESFARRLLEEAGFGLPAMLVRECGIGGDDGVAKHLSERVADGEKTTKRPYHIPLFETELDHREVLSIGGWPGAFAAKADGGEE